MIGEEGEAEQVPEHGNFLQTTGQAQYARTFQKVS